MNTDAALPNGRTQSDPKFSSKDLRRLSVAEFTKACCFKWFDADGRWQGESPVPDTRDTVWLCFGLLMGDNASVRLANAIIGRLEFAHHHPSRTREEEQSCFDIFVTNHMVQILAIYGLRLDSPVRSKMEKWARVALRDYAGDRQCDYQFHGANDNMPAKATLGLILGGEYFGDADAVEHGLWNLRQLRDLFTRRGLLSEYTSPTYLPLSIVNLTEIGLHARNAEARELAAQCAERIWADLLGHFHVPTGMMGGPYSRSYLPDSVGHINSTDILLWMALGDEVIPNPIEEMASEDIRLVHHKNRPSQTGLLAWLAACPLEPPAYLLQWLKQRGFPFELRATAERGGADEPLVAGEVLATHYQEEDFALGTAEGESWTQLQSEAFFLQYRLRNPLRGIEDRRTAFVRFLANSPAIPNTFGPSANFKGLIHTIQKDRVALVLARPVLSLKNEEIDSLKFSLVLSAYFTPVQKIEIQGQWVFIQDGPLFLALRALNVTNWGCKEPSRVEKEANFETISFFNYEGESRAFSEDELGRTLNGFLAIIGLEAEESWETFRNRAGQAEVLDYFHFGSRVVRCRVGETILGMSYAVKADRVRYATINGKPANRPVWQADGLDTKSLPFLGEDIRPNGFEFPYKHLRAVWAPEDHWTIGSSGNNPLE